MDASLLARGGQLRYRHGGGGSARGARSDLGRPQGMAHSRWHSRRRKHKQANKGCCWTCGQPGHQSSQCPSSVAPTAAAPAPATAGVNQANALIQLLCNPDTRNLLTRWLPLWAICASRRLCREARAALGVELSTLPCPTAIAGFSMKVAGEATGKFLRCAETFHWHRMCWLQSGHLPTRRADFAMATVGGDKNDRLIIIGGSQDVRKRPIAWADYFRPTLPSSAGAARP